MNAPGAACPECVEFVGNLPDLSIRTDDPLFSMKCRRYIIQHAQEHIHSREDIGPSIVRVTLMVALDPGGLAECLEHDHEAQA